MKDMICVLYGICIICNLICSLFEINVTLENFEICL